MVLTQFLFNFMSNKQYCILALMVSTVSILISIVKVVVTVITELFVDTLFNDFTETRDLTNRSVILRYMCISFMYWGDSGTLEKGWKCSIKK